jgi:serine/threonine protein phosphatase PrpC
MHPSINTVFSGSTCLSLIYTPPKIIIANTGDSRGIVGRYNALSKKWTHLPLSRDHKPSQEDEAERIIDQGGEIRPFRCKGQDAGPDRVWVKGREIPGLAMSRSFGDRVAETVGVICDPEIKEHYFEQDDKFIILASDGVWEYMKNKECVDLIQHFYMKGDIKGACENLYIECKRRWIKNEGVVDDITMIIIFLE